MGEISPIFGKAASWPIYIPESSFPLVECPARLRIKEYLKSSVSPLARSGQTAVSGRRKPDSCDQLVQGRHPGGDGAQAAPPAALQAEERSAAHRRADPLGRRKLHVRRRQRVRHHPEDLPGGGARIPGRQFNRHFELWGFGTIFENFGGTGSF